MLKLGGWGLYYKTVSEITSQWPIVTLIVALTKEPTRYSFFNVWLKNNNGFFDHRNELMDPKCIIKPHQVRSKLKGLGNVMFTVRAPAIEHWFKIKAFVTLATAVTNKKTSNS